MKTILILLFTLFTTFACASTQDRDVQVVLANLKLKKLEKTSDLKTLQKTFKKALPLMGSKGNRVVNIEVVRLYARSLKIQDYFEHLETIYPALKKEPEYYKHLINKFVKDEKIRKKFFEHISDYATLEKGGNS